MTYRQPAAGGGALAPAVATEMTSPIDVFRYGLRLGLDLLGHGELQYALPYLIRPVNYWRTAEYRAVLREARFRRSDRILDIGSPKLLSIYLAERLGAEVYATDIEDYFVEKLTRIRELRRIPSDRLQIRVEDGRRLTFPDGMFDQVYSISVLEHIPDTGDSACIREIARVLKPGGRCLLTVPFSLTSRVEYTKGSFYWANSSSRRGDQVFYQRRYSEEALQERLIEPSGLRPGKLAFIGERIMTGSERELSDLLPVLTGPIEPFLSGLVHTGPVASWRDLKKPLCAVVVLEKAGLPAS